MKKIFKSLLFAIALVSPVLFFNCAEEQLPAGVQLSLVQQRLHLVTTSASFGYNSNLTQTITVIGENTPWTLTGLPDWLTASATTGNGAATITLTAKENTSVDEARAAVLTFASTAADYQYSKTISVSQPVAIIYITPSEGTVSFMPKGESKTIGITSNVDWTATCSDTHFTVEKVNSTQLRVTAKENLVAKTQKATVSLLRTGTTTTYSTIDVNQAEAGVTGSTDNIAFAVDGETKTTTITVDATWTATVSDASWLTVTPADGSDGTATLTIKAEANTSDGARSGYVYVRIGSTNKLAIPVSQAGVQFSVSSSTVTLKSTTEPTTLNVTANAAWKVISKPEWLNATLPETLVGTNALILTPQDNPNTTSRTGQLVIGREGFSGNQTITVTQEGKTFGNLTAQMDFPVTASTQTVTVETDGAWTAATSTSWIHLSPSSGQGRGTLQVSVNANPGKDERTGAFTVTVGQTTQTVTVHQVGGYIIISCDDLITKSTPTTVNLFVSSNMNWIATSNVDWLTLEPQQGEGDAALTISVADNPSLSERTGTITLQSGEVTKAFSFTQPGRTLSLSISTETPITLPAAGGSSNTITVTTDGTYKVTASEDWLTIKESGNTFTIIAPTTNSISEREGTVIVSLTGLRGEEQLERSINVKQIGATLAVSETSLSFSAIGGTSDAITITTEGPYKITTSVDWLTVNETGKVFTITVNKTNSVNKRSAFVTITLTGLVNKEKLERIISVEQEPLSLQVSETSISFTYEGGTSETITVTTDGNYTVIPSDTWLTANERGNTFTVTATQNGGAARTATVTVALTGLKNGESKQATVTVTQKSEDPLGLCPNKKHPHAIDMGITVNGKNVKFACCNVGAEFEINPQVEYGDYFAWGETSGYNSGKTTFDWSTYKWCNGSESTMTKYCTESSYGTVDNKTQLELSDDAARANWGGSWRMPTIDELSALYNTSNCTWTWTTIGGKYGYKVTSKTTNNSIFLPAAGYRDATSLGGDIGSYGNFWSSSLDTSDDNYARYLVFYSSGRRTSSTYRYYGQSVRPVTE